MKISRGTKIFMTGAASGIGRSTALAAARRGARLFLTDLNEAGLKETAALVSQSGGEVVRAEKLDVSQYGQVRAFADSVHAQHGPMDIVMNIAGISVWGLVEDMTHAHWQKVINVDLWGPIHGIECFVPEMIRGKRGGHLLTVSSATGLLGSPWHAAYATAKWGCVGLSEVMRYDLAQHNIAVTVVCPGAVETPLKQTVEIIGVDRNTPYSKKLNALFSKHAVSPDEVARQIMDAVEKKKFLVITSFDIKLAYFLKRKCFPAYHLIMKKTSSVLNKAKKAR